MSINRAVKAFKNTHRVALGMIFLLLLTSTGSLAFSAATSLVQQEQTQASTRLVFNEQKKAGDETGKQRKITLQLDEVPLISALRTLAEKARLGLSYEKNMIPDKEVSLDMKDATVYEILDILLKDTHLEVALSSDRDVLIIRQKLDAYTIAETITGTVTDAKTGNTLPGVNVIIKGTTTGTSTDTEGRYELTVPSLQDTLVFSFIGYQTQIVPINGRTQVDVVMQSQAIQGEEMVVVGYGEQRSEDVMGAIGSVALENVSDQVVTGADELITGQISGVKVTKPAGIPGGGPKIQIRGVGSLGAGNEPLYVVDGFPIPGSSSVVSNPLNNIPPGDIASISVLKDASATAIYGSRGGNGVVLIETKEGTSGKMQVQINAYTGSQQVPQQAKPPLMNARQFAQFRKEAISDRIRFQENREPTPEDIPEAYRNPEQYGEGTDWYDEVTRTAPMHNLTFNISGGSENVQSYISGGFLTQEGVVLGTDYNRFTFRANVNASINDKFRVGLNVAPTFSNRTQAAIGGGGRYEPGFGTALVASPLEPVYNEDGSYNQMISSPGTFNYPNPVMQLLETTNESRTFNGILNGFAEYDLLNKLSIKSSINIQFSDTQLETFHPSSVGCLFQPPPVIPNGSFVASSGLNWVSENTLNYQDELAAGHNIKALVGVSIQQNNTTSANFNGEDFPDDQIKTLNAATRILGGTNHSDWSLVSYLARLNYDFQNKYLFTATVRRDGSSRFGSNNRWGIFPSGAVGWRISQESFMEEFSWLSELKLRASYGITGNFNIGNYTYLSRIGTSDYVFGRSRASGRTLNNLGNPNLGWERTREVNVGLDIGLWDDRVVMNVEYYHRITEDLLLNVQIPQSSGFSQVTENRGSVENRGLEFAVTSRNISRPNLNWTTNFNIAFNRNEVLELGRDNAPIFAGFGGGGVESNITTVGQPVGMFYGWVVDGIYHTEQEIQNSPSYTGAVPGNIKFKDINGDGVLTAPDDFTIIGNPYPDFTWGMTNSLQFEGFDLKLLITGSYGAQRYREGLNHYYHNIDGVFNVSTDIQNRWMSPEQPGDGKTPGTNGAQGRRLYRMVNSDVIEDNSYIWVKNISVGYRLPDQLIDGLLRSARIYLSMQNAILFTDYGGSNPEVTNYNRLSGGGALAPGLDFVSYPVPRITTLGIQLNL